MSNGLKSQGTELFFVHTLNSDPEMVKMACPTSSSGLGGPRDQVEDTCLDNTDEKTFVAGLGNPGPVTVPFVFNPQQASHQILFQLKNLGTTMAWAIGLSDGTAQPSANTDNGLDVPTSRSWFQFDAYIADVNIDIQTNDIVRGTMSLQRSGAVDFSPRV